MATADQSKYEIKQLIAPSPIELLRLMDKYFKEGWKAYGYIKFWEGDWRDRTYRAWVYRDKPQGRLKMIIGPVRFKKKKGRKNGAK